MNGDPSSGLKAADLVQIWIGLAVSLSAFFGWLLWRVTRLGTYQTMPNVRAVVAGGQGTPGFATLSLEGPTADRWKIARITITRPKGVQFLGIRYEQNDYGEAIPKIETPVGRKLDHPPSLIALSSLDEPVAIIIKLSLKAFPKLASFQPITISRND